MLRCYPHTRKGRLALAWSFPSLWEESTLDAKMMLHCGAKPVTRQQLTLVEPPPPTETWVPVKHSVVLDLVSSMLGGAGFSVVREQLGLTRDARRFFGTLDLRSELAAGITLAVGVRNSTDQSLPLGFCAGSRTFVCDNLAFSSELIVKRKHTKHGELRFREAISLAVGNLAQFQAAEMRRIESMQERILAPYEAEHLLLTAFERGILSARTLPKALAVYRDPGFDWGPRDRMWHLFNVINLPMQGRSGTNPQAFALCTMRLMALLGQEPGYDEPPLPDIVLEAGPDGSVGQVIVPATIEGGSDTAGPMHGHGTDAAAALEPDEFFDE